MNFWFNWLWISSISSQSCSPSDPNSWIKSIPEYSRTSWLSTGKVGIARKRLKLWLWCDYDVARQSKFRQIWATSQLFIFWQGLQIKQMLNFTFLTSSKYQSRLSEVGGGWNLGFIGSLQVIYQAAATLLKYTMEVIVWVLVWRTQNRFLFPEPACIFFVWPVGIVVLAKYAPSETFLVEDGSTISWWEVSLTLVQVYLIKKTRFCTTCFTKQIRIWLAYVSNFHQMGILKLGQNFYSSNWINCDTWTGAELWIGLARPELL